MKTHLLALRPPDPSVPIRHVTADDLNALMRACWADRTRDVGRWMLSRVTRNQKDRRGTGAVVLSDNGAIIGYGQLTLWPRCAEISDLFVEPQHRSKGYGTTIIQFLMQEAVRLRARCVEIGAAESNPRAMALYRRLGFVDHRTIRMNLGSAEREPVIYMKIQLGDDSPAR
jgi:ribosomal protein S18 acetylase RimI-like enzyme